MYSKERGRVVRIHKVSCYPSTWVVTRYYTPVVRADAMEIFRRVSVNALAYRMPTYETSATAFDTVSVTAVPHPIMAGADVSTTTTTRTAAPPSTPTPTAAFPFAFV